MEPLINIYKPKINLRQTYSLFFSWGLLFVVYDVALLFLFVHLQNISSVFLLSIRKRLDSIIHCLIQDWLLFYLHFLYKTIGYCKASNLSFLSIVIDMTVSMIMSKKQRVLPTQYSLLYSGKF